MMLFWWPPKSSCTFTQVVVPCKKRYIPVQFTLTPKLLLLSYSKHLYLMCSLILIQQLLDKSTQGQNPAVHESPPKYGSSKSQGCSVTNDLWHQNLEQLARDSVVWSSQPRAQWFRTPSPLHLFVSGWAIYNLVAFMFYLCSCFPWKWALPGSEGRFLWVL